MGFSMMLLAINGAAAQVASTQGVWPKARVAALLAYLLAKQVLGFATLLPSVSRSLLLYSSLPSHPHSHLLLSSTSARTTTTTSATASASSSSTTSASKARRLHLPRANLFDVSVARDISYGSTKRNLLDVYVPEAGALEAQRQWPVVMFVHGGVWASGNKEFFSHVGAWLAKYGVLAVVVQYTLFPEALAWEQARDVSRALTWVLDNAEHYGGDPHRVSLMGHSAGAHLAALVLWQRFKAARQLRQRRAAAADTSVAAELKAEIDEEDLDEQDTRQPCNFVGLAGVYDIVEHLKYERKRGVDTMSPMTPAMGGKDLLEAMSPVRLFYSVGGDAGISRKGGGQCCDDGIGMDNDASCCGNNNLSNGYIGSNRDVGAHVSGDNDSNLVFPSCTLLCSNGDTTVLPDTSVAFQAVLQEQLGLQVELVVFDKLGHTDFINLDGYLPEYVPLRSHILDILQA